MDGKPFQISADDISKFLGIPNERVVIYFENVTLDMVFWKYIFDVELDGKALKPGVVRYRNPVNAKDLTPLVTF